MQYKRNAAPKLVLKTINDFTAQGEFESCTTTLLTLLTCGIFWCCKNPPDDSIYCSETGTGSLKRLVEDVEELKISIVDEIQFTTKKNDLKAAIAGQFTETLKILDKVSGGTVYPELPAELRNDLANLEPTLQDAISSADAPLLRSKGTGKGHDSDDSTEMHHQ